LLISKILHIGCASFEGADQPDGTFSVIPCLDGNAGITSRESRSGLSGGLWTWPYAPISFSMKDFHRSLESRSTGLEVNSPTTRTRPRQCFKPSQATPRTWSRKQLLQCPGHQLYQRQLKDPSDSGNTSGGRSRMYERSMVGCSEGVTWAYCSISINKSPSSGTRCTRPSISSKS
jgi:hypothetical protein